MGWASRRATTLTITYTKNSNTNSNAAVGTVNQVVSPIITFKNEQLLDPVKVNYIRENVQVYNEDPINGYVTIPTTEELKYRYLGNYSAQGRAVTIQDYVTAVYSMPVTYGAVKRASIVRDTNDFRRNLNLYLISEGADGGLEAPSLLLKQNVKTWLNTMRMVSDSVDIFDAKILNLAIDVKVRIAVNANAQAVLSTIKQKLYKELMLIPPDVGQNFSVSEVRRILRQIPEVVDVANEGGVTVRNMVAGNKYSDYSYNISDNLSDDGGAIYVPDNTIWEIKYLDDITGTIFEINDGYKRYNSEKDNTIINALKENLSSRGSKAKLGASDILEVFPIFGQASTSSLEQSRILVPISHKQYIERQRQRQYPRVWICYLQT